MTHDAWCNVTEFIDYVCANWQQPDAGIWEFRHDTREFLHSRLMCWVAVDRALRLADEESLPAPYERWRQVRCDIYNDIFTNFWDEERQTFVQHRNTKALDAALLQMPLVNFIGPNDPRWLSTLDAIGRELACDALVRRYPLDDIDMDPEDVVCEGSFNACSFWHIACVAHAGRTQEAALLFSKMTGYANHVGLYAEETGMDGHQLGNFPQAFSHLALIHAVLAMQDAAHAQRASGARY
jgi:GH15 family glucan-1,4-alpha-glucosidase